MSVNLGTVYSKSSLYTPSQKKIVKSSNGTLLLFVWTELQKIQYKKSTDDGDTWGAWITVEDSLVTSGNTHDVIIDDSDNIYIAWVYNSGNIYVRKLTYVSGTTWTVEDRKTISLSGITWNLSIIKRPSGQLFVTYGRTHSGINDLYAAWSDDDGENWDGSFVEVTTGYANFSGIYSIEVGTDIWAIIRYSGGNLIYKIWNDGTETWGSNQTIATSIPTNIGTMSVGKVSDSEIYVSVATSNGIKVYKYTGSWDSGTLLSDNVNDGYSSVSIVGNKPVVAWNDYDGSNYNIAYRLWDGEDWESQVDLPYETGSYVSNSTIDSDSGTLYIAWIAGTGAPYTLYFDSIIFATEVLSDINNDFRFVKNYALDDITNDFRFVGIASIYNINNDFRLTGATLEDIDNDFRTISSITRLYINNDFRFSQVLLPDINNKINTSKLQLNNINNNFVFVKSPTLYNIANIINIISEQPLNINNDIRTKKEELNNITNDFRMIADWQIPGDVGFQSLGKEYIKVYIDSVEQTDAVIDSASIAKILNGTHTATFDLGRAYDSTKPDMEAMVEIKYKDWVLYKGYIIDISPTASPEAIKIGCNDKYWTQNKTNKYFFIGHKPQDKEENYYNTINEGLSSECDFTTDIGNFIPQTMTFFGQGESDCISGLVQNAGNFGWFYKEDETKKLWQAGKGDIVNIEAQSIGKNIGLYQIVKHQFRETIDGLVNKFRVQMGEKTIKRLTNTRNSYWTEDYWLSASPAWASNLEILARNSSNWYGWDYPEPEAGEKYKDVFRKYNLTWLDPKIESYTDKYPPEVSISSNSWTYIWNANGFIADEKILEGFTIDYENETITFNQPIYFYLKNTVDELDTVRRAEVRLKLWKNRYFTYTTYIGEDPETEIGNPLMFFTEKIGDYSETILKVLDLSGLSIQKGATYIDSRDVKHEIVSWDDTEFAKDYANWQLNKTADKKITGSIDITLDAFLFYNIDLSKRIMIDGVIDNPLNITSITMHLNSFTVTLGLESFREYKRSVSVPSRGE